jgi:hypothetical protein
LQVQRNYNGTYDQYALYSQLNNYYGSGATGGTAGGSLNWYAAHITNYHTGTGTFTSGNSFGAYIASVLNNSATLLLVQGATCRAVVSAGTTTYARALTLELTLTGGTVSNTATALYIGSSAVTSTVTSLVGIYIGGLSGAANNWGIYQASTGNKNYFAGNVGIGTTTPSYRLDVNDNARVVNNLYAAQGSTSCVVVGQDSTFSNTFGTSTVRGLYIYREGTWASSVNGSEIQINNTYASGSSANPFVALLAYAQFSGAAALSNSAALQGIQAVARQNGSTNISGGIMGAQITAGIGPSGASVSGTSGGVYGIYTAVQNLNASSTITNAYGLHVASLTATGAVTNAYGVFINNQSGATNSWGIYQNNSGDNNYFAGKIGIGTTSPTTMLHLASTDSVEIRLEADTDNQIETHNPRILFSQDGGLVTARIGYASGQNYFEIMQEYDDALVFGMNNTEKARINGNGFGIAGSPAVDRALTVYASTGNPALKLSNQTTAGTAGTAGGYFTLDLNGTTVYIPYYT